MIPLAVNKLDDYKKEFEPVTKEILTICKTKEVPTKLKDKVCMQVYEYLLMALAYKGHNDDILKRNEDSGQFRRKSIDRIKRENMDRKEHEEKI